MRGLSKSGSDADGAEANPASASATRSAIAATNPGSWVRHGPVARDTATPEARTRSWRGSACAMAARCAFHERFLIRGGSSPSSRWARITKNRIFVAKMNSGGREMLGRSCFSARISTKQCTNVGVEPGWTVRRAQGGDDEAFRRMYRSVQPGLLRYLRVMVGDDAEDIASETWLQIVRDLKSFSGDEDSFRGWAATVARHRALDHLRDRKRRPVADMDVDRLPARAGNDDTAVLALEAIATRSALAMIAKLPRDQAEAVVLRAVMGLDAKAAGKVMGKRAGAVRTAAHRGLRRLAVMLNEQNGFVAQPSEAGRRAVRGPGASTVGETLSEVT
jgi:RNA polymerase sigma-70 factor (ECF subfamily)